MQVQRGFEILNAMNDAFFVRLVPSEKLVFKTDGLVVALEKVSSDDVKGLRMVEGATKVKLPQNVGNIGGSSVNAKVPTLVLRNNKILSLHLLMPELPLFRFFHNINLVVGL